MKINKRILKLAMIANYVSTHPGVTRSELKNFLVEKGISKPYSNNLIAEARLQDVIAQENELMRMSDQSVLVLGENAGAYIKAYSEQMIKQADANAAGMNVHLQSLTKDELKSLMEEAAKALKAKDGTMTWGELGAMIDRMPEEAKRQKVCFWEWRAAWNNKCTLEITKEDFYEREEFGDAVPASYLDGNTEGCKQIASMGTYYIDTNS